MSNLPTIQLPAHLAILQQDSRFKSITSAASAGISSNGWPRISIKGSRFRLQTPQGEEVVVPKLDLDVIIVDANPHGLSKIYYAASYNPDGEDAAPDCYSDNGVGPSFRASKPQCGTCSACPHNIWGSKVTPNGKQTRACSDVKKVAVIMADNPEGPVFELRIPPASLKNWGTYIQALEGRGIPAAGVITKLKFDPNSDFPKLMFESPGWSTAAHIQAVQEVIGTEEADVCTGKNDKPVDASKLLAAPKPAEAAQQLSAPIVLNTSPLMGTPIIGSQLSPIAPIQEAVAEKPKRGRKPRMDLPTALAQEQPVAPVPPEDPSQNRPAFLNSLPPQQGIVTTQPPVTDAALDDMIKKAMAV